ncbi:hypothetical protein [Bacillus cereus]|uniref:hypothetical protein n=1 Tax=Bacillus cereus TaxID=1396 RepID=UPI0001A0A251|nr:hypothetical protein [Bacillus cereus]EEL52264.1 ROK [Bacillus cereus Rock3-44]
MGATCHFVVGNSREIITGGVDYIPRYASIPSVEKLQSVLKISISIENAVNYEVWGNLPFLTSS